MTQPTAPFQIRNLEVEIDAISRAVFEFRALREEFVRNGDTLAAEAAGNAISYLETQREKKARLVAELREQEADWLSRHLADQGLALEFAPAEPISDGDYNPYGADAFFDHSQD